MQWTRLEGILSTGADAPCSDPGFFFAGVYNNPLALHESMTLLQQEAGVGFPPPSPLHG